MQRSPTDRPASIDAKIDAKTGRQIRATIGLQLRHDFDADDWPLPDRLAMLLDEIQRSKAEH